MIFGRSYVWFASSSQVTGWEDHTSQVTGWEDLMFGLLVPAK